MGLRLFAMIQHRALSSRSAASLICVLCYLTVSVQCESDDSASTELTNILTEKTQPHTQLGEVAQTGQVAVSTGAAAEGEAATVGEEAEKPSRKLLGRRLRRRRLNDSRRRIKKEGFHRRRRRTFVKTVMGVMDKYNSFWRKTMGGGEGETRTCVSMSAKNCLNYSLKPLYDQNWFQVFRKGVVKATDLFVPKTKWKGGSHGTPKAWGQEAAVYACK